MSTPATAIGNNPTAVNTEYLPPTLSGIINFSYPSLSANVFKAPFSLSVVAIIRVIASSLPYLYSAISLKILNAIEVSVVVPDLEIQLIANSLSLIYSLT